MAKRKRASVTGKGVDIFFSGSTPNSSSESSGPAPKEPRPRTTRSAKKETPSTASASSTPRRNGEITEELSSLLAEEADAAESTPAISSGKPAAPVSHVSSAATASPRPAGSNIPPAPTESPEPALPPDYGISTPASTSPPSTTTSPRTSIPSTPTISPLSAAEASRTPGPAVPEVRPKPQAELPKTIRIGGALYERTTRKPTEEELAPEGPTTPPLALEGLPPDHDKDQPSPVLSSEEVIHRVTQRRINALWKEIEELYDLVPEVLCVDANQAKALQYLREAEDVLMERPRQYDVAAYRVAQVRLMVERRQKTSEWANTYGWVAFLYETLWLILFTLGFYFSPSVITWLQQVTGMGSTLPVFNVPPDPMWVTMMWGGIGGVMGAFYSLYWHVAKVKDFDKQYMMWYIVQPIVGIMLGGGVFLIIATGFISGAVVTGSEAQTISAIFPSLLAWIAGFRQRFILEMIDRIIQLVTPAPPSESTAEEEDQLAALEAEVAALRRAMSEAPPGEG